MNRFQIDLDKHLTTPPVFISIAEYVHELINELPEGLITQKQINHHYNDFENLADYYLQLEIPAESASLLFEFIFKHNQMNHNSNLTPIIELLKKYF